MPPVRIYLSLILTSVILPLWTSQFSRRSSILSYLVSYKNNSPTKDADKIYLLHGLIPTDVTKPACSYSSAEDYLLSGISFSLILYLIIYDKTFFRKSFYFDLGFTTRGLISYIITFLSLPPDTMNLESCDIFTHIIPAVCPTNV